MKSTFVGWNRCRDEILLCRVVVRRIWFHPRLDLGFHLSRAKISSWCNHDFIKPTEKEITFRIKADLLSLSVCKGVRTQLQIFWWNARKRAWNDGIAVLKCLLCKLEMSLSGSRHMNDFWWGYGLLLPARADCNKAKILQDNLSVTLRVPPTWPLSCRWLAGINPFANSRSWDFAS